MGKQKKIWLAVINDLTFDQRMHRICRALQGGGYQVTLVGRRLKDSLPLQDESFAQKRLSCFFRKGPFMYLEFNMRLFLLFLRNQIDIHGACDLDTLLALRLAAKFRGRPTVFDAHEYFTEVPEVMNRPIVKRIWKWVGRSQIPKTAQRYTVNRPLADELEIVYQVPFEVVRNVPNLHLDQNEEGKIVSENKVSGKKDRIMIYQGALNVGRGLEVAIESLQFLPEYQLWMVGEGDISGDLKAYTKSCGVQKQVHFHGLKEPKELKLLTYQASVGLNLLDGESKNYYFSLANKFFDYLHANIPSVNMDFPVYRSILKQYNIGVCIEKLDAEELAEAIKKLQGDNKNQRDEMNADFNRAKAAFNWEKEKIELLRIWSTV